MESVKDTLRRAFGPCGEIESLEPTECQVTPSSRMMDCDACQAKTRHELSADGHWVCWCGYDQNAVHMEGERIMMLIEATARLLHQMTPTRRRRFVRLIGETIQDKESEE